MEVDCLIAASAARNGCCDRGSSIAGAGDERLFVKLKYLIHDKRLLSNPPYIDALPDTSPKSF